MNVKTDFKKHSAELLVILGKTPYKVFVYTFFAVLFSLTIVFTCVFFLKFHKTQRFPLKRVGIEKGSQYGVFYVSADSMQLIKSLKTAEINYTNAKDRSRKTIAVNLKDMDGSLIYNVNGKEYATLRELADNQLNEHPKIKLIYKVRFLLDEQRFRSLLDAKNEIIVFQLGENSLINRVFEHKRKEEAK